MKTVTNGKITWIDLSENKEKDIKYLKENFDIHPLAIEEFSTPTYRPRATKYPNCLFVSIHIPLYDKNRRTTYPSEVDVIMTKTHLITGHADSIYQVEELMNLLENDEKKKNFYMNKTPSHLLYTLIEILINSCFPRLEHVAKKMDNIEENIFKGEEKEMVKEISILKRDILNFRRAIMPQKTILESILRQPDDIVPQDIKPYYHDLIGTNIRLWNALESSFETVRSLEETNNSLLSQKVNDRMRVITAFSTILIPMTLYANILGINVKTPLATHPNGFLIHVSIMILISVLTYILFKLLKWI